MTTVVIIQLQCKKKHSHIKWLCLRKVEARRIELLSKHILQKLSTCLFRFRFRELTGTKGKPLDKLTTD